jgi:hypothetical protein
MNKWQIQPHHWHYLTQRQQKRMFKTGYHLAGALLLVMVVFSLLIETVLGL